MPINQRITSAKARFARDPDMVKRYLEGYSKKNPATVSQEIFDAVRNNSDLKAYHDRVKLAQPPKG